MSLRNYRKNNIALNKYFNIAIMPRESIKPKVKKGVNILSTLKKQMLVSNLS